MSFLRQKTKFFPAALSFLLVVAMPMVSHAQEASDIQKDIQLETPETKVPVPSRFGEAPTDQAFGAFQRGLYITARNLALPRAEKGDAAAQTLLAEIYSRGLGVARNVDEAAKWYEKAAKQGVPEAKFQFALMLLNRGKPDEATKAQAITMMQEAADSGIADAQFNYAQLLLADRTARDNRSAAFSYFLKAAEQKVPDAQYAVSQFYLNGSDVADRDLVKAREWLTKAATNNFGTAQLELGNMLLNGDGGERDLKGGFAWIKRAAEAGNIQAQANLGKLYWGGIGVEPDSVEAAAWYVLARRAGLRDAVLDDFWEGLEAETQQAAIARANRLR